MNSNVLLTSLTDQEIIDLIIKFVPFSWVKKCIWKKDVLYSEYGNEKINWNPLINTIDASDLVISFKLSVRWDTITESVIVTSDDSDVVGICTCDFNTYMSKHYAFCRAICMWVANMQLKKELHDEISNTTSDAI